MSSDTTSADRRQATVDRLITGTGTEAGAGAETGLVVSPGPDSSLRRRTQRGMVSAEWTVGIIAAIAIAGVLLAVVTAGPVEDALLRVILSIIKTFTRGL